MIATSATVAAPNQFKKPWSSLKPLKENPCKKMRVNVAVRTKV
jgi:hypothetical protein